MDLRDLEMMEKLDEKEITIKKLTEDLAFLTDKIFGKLSFRGFFRIEYCRQKFSSLSEFSKVSEFSEFPEFSSNGRASWDFEDIRPKVIFE